MEQYSGPLLILREEGDLGGGYFVPRGVKPIHLYGVLVHNFAEVLNGDEELTRLARLDLELRFRKHDPYQS